jgi:hypothetical protein
MITVNTGNGELYPPRVLSARRLVATAISISGRFVVITSLYLLLALGITWPLARDFTTRVIGEVWFDQRHSIWLLWHTKEWILGRQPLFIADLLYYPVGISTVGDGVGPLSGLLALVFWPWGPTAAYNGALLLGFVLTAVCMYWLASSILKDRPSAFVTGALFMLWPIHVVSVYGHLEKAFMGLLPLNILAAHFAFDHTKARRWMWAPGMTLLLALIHNGNQFIFALLGVAVVLATHWWYLPRQYWRRFGARVALTGMAAVAINGAMLVKIAHTALDPQMDVAFGIHSPHYSPDALQFVLPSIDQAIPGRWFYLQYDVGLSGGEFTRASVVPSMTAVPGWPGWYGSGIETAITVPLSALLLAIIGLRYRKGEALRWIGFGLVFAILACGPYLRFGGRTAFTRYGLPIVLPYAFLSSVPGFDFMRTPGRFMMIGAVGFAIAAGIGIVALRRRWPPLAAFSTGVVLVILLVECWPRPWGQQVPLPISPFYHRLSNDPARFAVLDLPSGQIGDYASAYQWYQLTHHKAIAWGYLSRQFREFPVEPIRKIMGSTVVDAAHIRRQLVNLGYRYVIWHKHAAQLFTDRSPSAAAASLAPPVDATTNDFIRATFIGEEPVFEDSLITVYALDAPQARQGRTEGTVGAAELRRSRLAGVY